MADINSSITPPEQGKTTIDDKLFFEPDRLSYQSAGRIAGRIAEAVKGEVTGRSVVIARTSLLVDFANLNATVTTLKQLAAEYDALTHQVKRPSPADEEPQLESEVAGTVLRETIVQKALITAATAAAVAGIAGGGVVAPVVGAALGLAALLKQDVEYHGEQTSVDTLAFELALGNDVLAQHARTVYIPDLTVLAPNVGSGSLQDLLSAVQRAKSDAWSAVGPLIAKLTALERELDVATRAKEQAKVDQLASAVASARRDLDPLALPLERADQRVADLQTQWGQVDTTTGLSVLARILRAESLQALKPVYLHAAVVASGGHHRISRNAFRLVGFRDGLSFLGGAIVRWAVLNDDGSLAKGGIFTEEKQSLSVPAPKE